MSGIEQLRSMAAMFPHLYGGLPTSTSLSTMAVSSHFPMAYPSASLMSPLLSAGLTAGKAYGFANESSERVRDSPSSSSSLRASPPFSDGKIKVTLDDQELWQRFHLFGTEMIVTRSGRRMFPILKIKIEGLDVSKKYFVILDIVPLDDARYKFCNGQWTVSGRAEPHFPSRLFVHPDSPASGRHWMEEGAISFHRVKLTNNNKDQSANILLNSMHRYQPRIHVAEAQDVYSMNWSKFHTFSFPNTSFFAVTAYQNENITQLKIDNNPFAKGFRDREKTFPQKRSAPFMEQLREAATTEIKHRKLSHHDEEDNSKTPLSTSDSHSVAGSPSNALTTTSLSHYSTATKLDLLRHRLAQQSDTTPVVAHPLFPFHLNKLPMVNFPFSLFSNRPCS